jgi:hypothetical protein
VKKWLVVPIAAIGLAGCASGGSKQASGQDDANAESKANVRTVCRKERTSGGSTGSRLNVERVCEQVIEPAGE